MDTINEFMSRDHDRLDAILAAFRRGGDPAALRELFQQFDSGLRAHIAWEEEILFPSFEEKTGMRDAGPTAVMRMEHQQIKQLLQTILDQIGQQDPGQSVNALIEVLTAHNMKEERILYPWIDRTLAAQDVAGMLDRIARAQAGASSAGG